jgi:hypothetical protein
MVHVDVRTSSYGLLWFFEKRKKLVKAPAISLLVIQGQAANQPGLWHGTNVSGWWGNHTPTVPATPTVENPGDLHPQRAGLCLVKPWVVWHRQLVRALPSPETWEWGRPKIGSSQDWINPGWATKGVPRNWHNSLVIVCRPKWWGPA